MSLHSLLTPDPTRRSAPPRLERSVGLARVTLAGPTPHQGQGQGARLERLYQSGSAKAVPLFTPQGAEIAFLNTSGGLCGGDRLGYALDLAPGARATATTQTAERAYRADRPAEVSVEMKVGAGGWLDWLPQETILFDGAQVVRRTEVALGAGAGCLLAESVILGRIAMGETVSALDFRDTRAVRQAGRLLWLEPLHLCPDAFDGLATLRGARALASVALIRPGAGDLLSPLRAVLTESGVAAAASALPDRLMLRMMAADGWPLRRQLARALAVLRQGAPLPRVWQM